MKDLGDYPKKSPEIQEEYETQVRNTMQQRC